MPDPDPPEMGGGESCLVRTGEDEMCTEETRPDGIVVMKCTTVYLCSDCTPVQGGTCTWQGSVESCFGDYRACTGE